MYNKSINVLSKEPYRYRPVAETNLLVMQTVNDETTRWPIMKINPGKSTSKRLTAPTSFEIISRQYSYCSDSQISDMQSQ